MKNAFTGWKANELTLKQQVAGVFNGDLGLTTSVFPNQNCLLPQNDCSNSLNGGKPEIIDKYLAK